MRNRLRALLSNTRLRYIMSYILITVILLSAIGIYTYSYYSKSVYESTVSGETGLMYQIKYLCDGYMNLAESCALRLSSLQDSELEGAASLMRITADGDEIVCVSGSAEAEKLVFDEYEPDFGADTLQLLPSQTVTAGSVPGEYITLICPVEGKARSLICLIPADSLRLLTENEDTSLRSRYILWNGEIVASSAGFSMDSAQVVRPVISSGSSHSEIRRVNGREYLFTSLDSSIDSVSYVSALALTGIQKDAAGLFLGFAAFLMLLAVPCIGFMFFISRQNLKPILELGKRFGSTGGDEISTIDQGIRNLEGENAALNDMVTGSLPARRHLFVKQLIRGLTESRESARSTALELGIDISKAHMCVIITGSANGEVSSEEISAQAPDGVSAAGMELLEHSEILIAAFSDDPALLDSYAECMAADEKISSLHLPVAVSNVHTDLSQLPDAYLEASAAYESRFIMSSQRLLRFSDIPVKGRDRTDNAKYIARIKDALSKGDNQALDICLNELMLCLKGGDMTLFAFRKLYNDIISAVASEGGAETYDLFSLSGCSSIDELDGILRSACSRVIAARIRTGAVSPVKAMVKMMTEHYTNSEFSLASAAEETGVSNTRLTAEFKSAMGMTPADYLTALRMEQAKKLLSDTDLPVRDISLGSGYADASSFTRRFKIYTGMTPLQYRQSAKNGELLDT